MIPKIIHYCWFGGKPLPENVKAYIQTWKENFPDFEIKQWDESNFDINYNLYTRQAYFAKKYAFVSDVARLYALYTEGGLYFDTDILIKKPFPEEWFSLDGFGSFEHDKYVQTGIIGASKNNKLIKDFLDIYMFRRFFKGLKYDITTNVAIFTSLMEKSGFKMNNKIQTINNFTVFPQVYLCANDWITGRYNNSDTFAIHDFGGAWGKEALKSKFKFRLSSLITILNWHI